MAKSDAQEMAFSRAILSNHTCVCVGWAYATLWHDNSAAAWLKMRCLIPPLSDEFRRPGFLLAGGPRKLPMAR